MHVSNLRRIGVLAWPVVVGAVLLAACGSDDDASPSRSTIELNNGSTAFVVKEPATTVPIEPVVNEDGTTSAAQEYEVQPGDYPILVAQKFEVPLEELVSFNEWSDVNGFPGPGAVIKIPPGGVAGGNVTEETAEPAADESGAATTAPAETIPEAGDNCQEGSYTITADDTTRIGVAEKFDVTVEALDAANAGTPGYAAFFPGLEIVIPAKADC